MCSLMILQYNNQMKNKFVNEWNRLINNLQIYTILFVRYEYIISRASSGKVL